MTTPFLKNAFLSQLTEMEMQSYQFASVYLKDAFSLPKSNAYIAWLFDTQNKSAMFIQHWWKTIKTKKKKKKLHGQKNEVVSSSGETV